ncbi:Ras-associated and pleckstrin y domains-containing protein 1 [Chionoecetes opilio]|uniref:Ras-associated and pleckstrin y domains-containing protein 1 n=1 Tax=Chionoecetes opilio TaxID=41210 RepID=A0A8J4Y4P4_CHIOP|nr:Ras-associated and pleckstrin y domains-containing protein 1 [Chionoecetes opilio]
MALEKIKEANVKKLFIKAFTSDGSTKSLLVDEKMTVVHVTRLLADKNHVRMDPQWAIVEHIPDLYMDVVENLLLWTRESKNTLLFSERADKYDLFLRPEHYILIGSSSEKNADLDDEGRNTLVEEFFSSTGVGVPEVEGHLFLKSEGKKVWKKYYFVLRASGLYYCAKGKSSRSSKDLVCLTTLEVNQVYYGVGWKKKYKAPTDWCFAIKHPHLQAKSSKYIKYLCCDDPETLSQWVMGVRIAKSGSSLLENYRSLVEDLAQEDIDMLASSRSFSIASMAAGGPGGSGGSHTPSQATTPSSESRSLDSCLAPSLADGDDDASSSAGSSSQDTPVNTLGRRPDALKLIDCEVDSLPPPPPELLASTLSLNSLPPPPDEASLPPSAQTTS